MNRLFRPLREFPLDHTWKRNVGACWKGTPELIGKERRSLLERNARACWKGTPELVGKGTPELVKLVALSSSGTFEKKWRVPVISSLIDAISDKTS